MYSRIKVNRLFRTTIISLLILSVQACVSHSSVSLYQKVGGQSGVEKLSDAFIAEIQYDKQVLPFFLETNIDRFREKFIEHLCVQLDGPCTYSGDTMIDVHKGMNINEADFNRVVELMVNAMTKIGLAYPIQNQVLSKLAPFREEIIYK